MNKSLTPRIPEESPKWKAQDLLARKAKDDVMKEVLQLIYLSEDFDLAKSYWTQVLDHVNSHQVKIASGYIG